MLAQALPGHGCVEPRTTSGAILARARLANLYLCLDLTHAMEAPMVCPVCRETKYRRVDWFNPQWQAHSPIVMGHQGGDFDRCKACYYNIGQHAPGRSVPRRDDATAIVLAKELKRLGRPLASGPPGSASVVEEFLASWMSHPTLVETFHGSGAVETTCPTDPKQRKTRDGRSLFDPTNKVYEKCFHLLWPNLVGTRKHVNLGNVIESVLGVREQAVKQRHFLQEDEAVNSLCKRLGEFVNVAYHFIMYTDSREDPVRSWVEFVHRLQVPDVD